MRTIDPSDLRDRIERLGPDLAGGRTAGYVRAGEALNLNAIAIGLGLERVTFEPDRFPGLVYRTEAAATTVAFEDGTVAAVDAPDAEGARAAVAATVDAIEDLGLIEDAPPAGAVDAPAAAVPVPEDVNVAPEAGGCPDCGEPLDGGEAFCPACGAELGG